MENAGTNLIVVFIKVPPIKRPKQNSWYLRPGMATKMHYRSFLKALESRYFK
jgi:hypothetical protein